MLESKGSSGNSERRGYKKTYHHPWTVHSSCVWLLVEFMSMQCLWCRLWDKFSKTYFSTYLQRRQKPKTSIFQEHLQAVWKFTREPSFQILYLGFGTLQRLVSLYGDLSHATWLSLIPLQTCTKSSVVPSQTTAPRTITYSLSSAQLS